MCPVTISTGIFGLDTILGGGYTRSRATVIRGASGSGKSLFSLMFAADVSRTDAVVFATFDEPAADLERYARAWNQSAKISFVEFIPDPETVTSGPASLDLGAVLVRLEHAISKNEAKFLVIDAFDNLFTACPSAETVKLELHRVFAWCRSQGITLLATGGIDRDYTPSRDLMDYASDCTILLQQNLENGLMTRSLRVLKLRGRSHGTNEYPFLIDQQGISVLPVTDTALTALVSDKYLKTGCDELDQMLGGKGFWHGSTMMISGESGSGKSILAASIVERALEDGMKVLYTSFEESPEQFIRDVSSAGIEIKKYMDAGTCQLVGRRAVELGTEEHVILFLRLVEKFQPNLVVIDPISALRDLGDSRAFKSSVIRLSHALKSKGVTVLLTELIPDAAGNRSDSYISSMVDTWIRLSRVETNREMHREIKVHKSRGAATSNKVREFQIGAGGIEIV